MKRVVVTGLGTVNPLGTSAEEFWGNIKANKLGFSYIDQFNTENFDIKIVGAVKDFDCSKYIDKKDAKRLERFNQFATYAALDALNDCGSDFKEMDPYRVGVIMGVGIGGLEFTEKEVTKYNEKGPDRISVFYIPMMIANMAAGNIAIKTGFKGANFATVTACASSTHAVGEAFRKIKDGYLDVCVCGGAESCITEFALGGFNNMKALSKATELDKASTPFDLNRQGFVLGEGSGVLILEELEHAKARGAKIYAEVVGYGATCDAYHITAPAPDGQAAAESMRSAYKEAGLNASDITYINAHGTSTGLNDAGETAAVKLAFGEEQAKKILINSTKSMTGHLLGGAGGMEAIVLALSIRDNFVHKTVGFETPDPECDLNYCTEKNIETEVKAGLSNSLGFGGHNATICMKKYV
ncbi:MAG TPA: beta-ketoacyl-ACP synthase II [Oscillospiraceae bacterium]|nr:beta-ketoacyl-ACP synthase II [Oscillospiraceae bacterium]